MMDRKLVAVGVAVLALALGCRPEMQPTGGKRSTTPSAEVVLSAANFQDQVLKNPKPVMVDVFATWCRPCQEMAPIVEELAGEFQGRAVVGKLDGDQNDALAREYGVAAYPTFLFFKNGRIVDQVEGGTSKADLAGRLEALVEK
jgi:thioredoxin 1